ncbi:hypothetical protein [Pandoraea bronchicola]|uniref:hypothetical protein n=1 Tax=Pandoraea bronchicola TaxID=2508287 RepID=UPI001242439B|nr:hypothetical protein [Pandoraea bronchicola]
MRTIIPPINIPMTEEGAPIFRQHPSRSEGEARTEFDLAFCQRKQAGRTRSGAKNQISEFTDDYLALNSPTHA